jgi:hypothetical protein
MPSSSSVAADGETFDVAGSYRQIAMEEPALDDGYVPDELAVLVDENVDPPERVLPVLVAERIVERVVEELAHGDEIVPRNVGRVGTGDGDHLP